MAARSWSPIERRDQVSERAEVDPPPAMRRSDHFTDHSDRLRHRVFDRWRDVEIAPSKPRQVGPTTECDCDEACSSGGEHRRVTQPA